MLETAVRCKRLRPENPAIEADKRKRPRLRLPWPLFLRQS